MKLLPQRSRARTAVILIYVVVVLIALIAVFEFVVNRRLLPANY